MTHNVFSEFEVDKTSVKFEGDTEYSTMDCVGSSEETLNTKIITKKCRGTVAKTRTKATGDGTLKMNLHVPYDIFIKAWGLSNDGLKDGVYKYGKDSRHKEFCLVQHVMDEDGNEKLKAYPRCIIQTGITRKVENGAEEVAESELEIAIMPDSDGVGMYEALADNLDSATKNAWLTSFSSALVKSGDNTYSLTYALTGCTVSNKATSIEKNGMYVTKVEAKDGYTLPSSITVNDGSALTSGTDYMYDNTNGMLVIKKVDANTTITITATETV